MYQSFIKCILVSNSLSFIVVCLIGANNLGRMKIIFTFLLHLFFQFALINNQPNAFFFMHSC